MSGDPTKATIWGDADVYVAPLGSALPANIAADFPAAWGLVGLLDGEAGFVQARSEDKADHYAWGGVLVRVSRRNFKLTEKFTALEDNDVTRDLIWPGSSATEVVVPRPVRLLVAFETRDGDIVRRRISAYQAEIDVDGDLTENEADLTKYPLLVTIYPDTSESPPVLFIEQSTGELGS